jgi:hypothetical protein
MYGTRPDQFPRRRKTVMPDFSRLLYSGTTFPLKQPSLSMVS